MTAMTITTATKRTPSSQALQVPFAVELEALPTSQAVMLRMIMMMTSLALEAQCLPYL
jgi:hypothetical protein